MLSATKVVIFLFLRQMTLYVARNRGLGVVGPGFPEGGVGAADGEQLVVTAELADPAVLHHRDTVGVVCGVEPVCDRDNRAPFDHCRERPLEMTRAARVEQ